MRTFILGLSAAALGFAATPALAQAAPGAPFTGLRAGAILGYDVLRPGSGDGSSIRGDHHADGLVYGGDVGYDVSTGGAVLGVEGEVTGSTAKTSNSPVDSAALGYGRVKTGRDLYLGVRGGFRAGYSTLVYAKAGYTNARLDLTASDGTTETGNHYNLDGYRLGAGVEEALGPRTYAKLEYRYSNYRDARFEYASGGNTNNFDVDTDRHQVVAGVGFRF